MCPVYGHTEETNKILKELIWRRVWRDDIEYGYLKIDKGNSIVMRNYADMAVLSSERIIAIALVITEAPFVKHYESSTTYDGGILDLTKISFEDEEDYRPKFDYEKSLITGLKNTIKKVSTPKHKIINNNIIESTIQTKIFNGEILISDDTKKRIVNIYSYFQNNKYSKYQEIKEFVNDKVVVAFLTHLGFDISTNLKFKIREESTPSCSINYNGFIKDFGSDFAGNIISLLSGSA